MFIIDAATSLGYAVLVFRAIPETMPQTAPDVPRTGGSVLTPFLDPSFWPFLFVQLLMVIVFAQFQVALPADMQAKGLSLSEIGIAIAVNGVLIVALQPLVTQRLAGWRRSRALALAAVCIGVGFGANALALTMPQFMLIVCIWTFGEIIMAPANASIVADLSPASMRGRYQGAFGLVWALGVTLGPLLSGAIIQRFDTRTLWISCIGVGLLAAGGQVALGPSRLKRLEQLGLKPQRD
jgi:MFS family permease